MIPDVRPDTVVPRPAGPNGRPDLNMLISHLQRTLEERSAPGYCKYLDLRLDGTKVRAMVDSGNTWRSAISIDLCRQLGYREDQLIPLPDAKVGTANKEANLALLGEIPTAFNLTIDSVAGRTFPFRPIVIGNLSMAANLSGPVSYTHLTLPTIYSV